jgi:putative CRISPR-associated protein (TIGR02619 family)
MSLPDETLPWGRNFIMLYHHIVITAGISLFSGMNIFRQWHDAEIGLFEFDRTNPLAPQGKDAGTLLESWKAACVAADLSGMAGDAPKNVSAEFSLLHALQAENQLGDKPQVVLIHTASLGGRAAAALLERLIADHFAARVATRPVDDLDPNDRLKLRRSLGGFMQAVAESLEGHHPLSTCFAPMGGYKIMTSLGYLAGAYRGFPTAYLHEDGQVLQEIPAVPIRIDAEEVRASAPLLRRLRASGILEWAKISEGDREMVGRHPYLFDRVDNLLVINAFGEFLMKQPEHAHLFACRVFLSQEAERAVRDRRHRGFIFQQIRELIKKLDFPERYWGELRHDLDFSSLRNNPRFFLFKGARNGNLTFSAGYRHDSDNGALRLNRIWTDHNEYERKAEKGDGFFDEPSDIQWQDWSNEVHGNE